MEIKIVPKYEFDQEVWYKVEYPATEICDACHGEGILHGISYNWSCNYCGGTGKRTSKDKKEYSVLKAKIYSYRAMIYKGGIHLKYRLAVSDDSVVNKPENDLFGSEEEALAWCEEENRKSKNNA